MSKEHEICKKTIDTKVKEGIPFSFEEIQNEVLENGGILRVVPGTTIGMYLEDLEDREVIDYLPNGFNYLKNGTLTPHGGNAFISREFLPEYTKG